MNKNLILLILFAIIVIPVFLLLQNKILLPSKQTETPKQSITIDGHTFSLLLAKTEAEKEKGLSGKSSISQDTGMLFIFDKADFYDFWMKDMEFPLDIIWINKDKIVTIQDDLQPATTTDVTLIPRFKSIAPADRVLEINAGLAKKYNFKNGDTVKISL